MKAIETLELQPGYRISRVIRGGWQLAGGHGAIDRDAAIDDMIAYYDSGITTMDCADIYTGVEELIGAFRARLISLRGLEAAKALKVHTKLVPDLEILPVLTRNHVRAIVEKSLKNLQTERLDLVQLHWWDYAAPGFMEAFHWLADLRREGKIDLIGGTNFDVPHVSDIVAGGVPLASLQVQYSVLDRRPEHGLAEICRAHGISLLCYGSVAGGFLSDRWLGLPEPAEPLENRSLVKYKLIIDDFGGWNLFQDVLKVLRGVADRHGVDIATIASRYVLDRPAVAGVIVGARNRDHVVANARISALKLAEHDHQAIESVVARGRGPVGDTYTLERDRTGKHGSIMKYNLNSVSP